MSSSGAKCKLILCFSKQRITKYLTCRLLEYDQKNERGYLSSGDSMKDALILLRIIGRWTRNQDYSNTAVIEDARETLRPEMGSSDRLRPAPEHFLVGALQQIAGAVAKKSCGFKRSTGAVSSKSPDSTLLLVH